MRRHLAFLSSWSATCVARMCLRRPRTCRRHQTCGQAPAAAASGMATWWSIPPVQVRWAVQIPLPTSPTSATTSKPCEPSARSCAAHQAVGPQLAARHAQHRARRPVGPAYRGKLRIFKVRLPITLAQQCQLLTQPAVRMALQAPVLSLLCGSYTAHTLLSTHITVKAHSHT